MTLCPDCRQAEDDRLHPIYTGQLCCHARAIMSGIRRDREATTVAVKRALNPAEWAIVRARLLVLIERERAADAPVACEKGASVSRRGADGAAVIPGVGEARKAGVAGGAA
jgi:hypothetical protein